MSNQVKPQQTKAHNPVRYNPVWEVFAPAPAPKGYIANGHKLIKLGRGK